MPTFPKATPARFTMPMLTTQQLLVLLSFSACIRSRPGPRTSYHKTLTGRGVRSSALRSFLAVFFFFTYHRHSTTPFPWPFAIAPLISQPEARAAAATPKRQARTKQDGKGAKALPCSRLLLAAQIGGRKQQPSNRIESAATTHQAPKAENELPKPKWLSTTHKRGNHRCLRLH